MKLTLLGLTQNILSALNSDQVNSISDTTESLQVAEIIRTTYFNMVVRYNLPEHNQLTQLVPSNSDVEPVLMFCPDGVNEIKWIKYYNLDSTNSSQSDTTFIHDLNLDLHYTSTGSFINNPGYKEIKILPIKDFLYMVNRLDLDADYVDTFDLTVNNLASGDPETFTLRYRTDKIPQYCCVIQNYYVIFDSYDSSVDSTLQASKVMAYCRLTPEFRMEDTFIPNLDEEEFPLLLNEAKSLAFLELKQMTHAKAEEEVKRMAATIQKNKSVVDKPSYFDELPNFGRRRFVFR